MSLYSYTQKPDWTPGPLGRDQSELDKVTASPMGWIYTWDDGAVEVLVGLNNLVNKASAATDITSLPTFTAAVSDNGGTSPALVTGDVMTITLTASEAVNVAGAPYIVVDMGAFNRNFVYDFVNSTDTSLLFKYTVVAGDIATAGQVTAPTALTFGTYDGVGDKLTATGGTNWLTAVTYTAPDTSLITVN